MKQILVRITPELARSLERIAPGHGRKRSEFIRQAIVKAILEAEDVRTEEAYRRSPQEPIAVDAGAWAPDAEAVRFTEDEIRRMVRTRKASEQESPHDEGSRARRQARPQARAPSRGSTSRDRARAATRTRSHRRDR